MYTIRRGVGGGGDIYTGVVKGRGVYIIIPIHSTQQLPISLYNYISFARKDACNFKFISFDRVSITRYHQLRVRYTSVCLPFKLHSSLQVVRVHKSECRNAREQK
jgi:hypothetical protein